jgi:biopolymer transport protein ExbD
MLLPSRGQVTIQSESRIPTVTIYNSSRVTVDGRTVSLDDLGPVLDARLRGMPEPTIRVLTSPSVSVGDAVKVMNVAAARNYTVVLKQL